MGSSIRRLAIVAALLAATVAGQRFSVAQRQADLNYVANQVPMLHANFFFQLSPATYGQAVAALQAQISTLTDDEFYVQLAALIALAGDAHTLIYLNDAAAVNAGFLQFPLQFRWLDDGVFVSAAAPAYSQALGAQLIAVGGVLIDQVVPKLGTIIPHGNDQWLHYMSQQYLAGQQILEGLDLLPVSSPSSLTFQSLDGTQFTLQVAPSRGSALKTAPDPTAGPVPDYLQQGGVNYWYTYSAANHMLYFKYNACDNDPANPFTQFAAQVLATVDSQLVDTLVLDFRGNTGGDSSLINPLVNGLQSRAGTLLSNPQFYAYVAIDKGTFSSAMDNAMTLKIAALDLASQIPSLNVGSRFVVIGEPTGGQPAEFGEVVGFTLPGSGLDGQYSTEYFLNPAGIPDTPSFMPDIAISTRSTDFFARYDPVFGAMLARTAAVPAPPSGNVIVVNGASFRIDQGIAPGSFASAFGNFSSTPDNVTVNGAAAQVVAANASQVNFITPAPAAAGTATVSVTASGTPLANGQFTISPTGPGVFVLGGMNPAQPGAVENQDFSINSPSNPAAQGSVVQVFATGDGGAASAAQVQVFFGDTPAQVLFSGEVGQYLGLWQINAVVPTGVTGEVPVFLVEGNLASNAVTIAVM